MRAFNKVWLFVVVICSLCFGSAMFQVIAQSRPFRREAVSPASTLKSISIGIISGLIFFAVSMLLSLLYERAKLMSGKSNISSILLRVLIGAIIGASVGSTIYVPLLGNNLAVVFIDYHGVILYFTGAFGGCVGAVIGAVSSMKTVHQLVIKIVIVLSSGFGGLIVGGFIISPLFIALFTAPFTV